MKYKSILITGGLGFVGGRITRLLGNHYRVFVSSRKQPEAAVLKKHANPEVVLHDQLLNQQTFPENIDVVIHLAALNEMDCVKFPSEAIRVNVDETRIILENAMNRKVKKFIYFSTVHVYGAPLTGCINEESLPRPIHPYSITHKAAEDYVNAAHDKKQIEGLIVRLSNSFGAPVSADVNRWTLLVNDLCRQAATTKQLKLNSNGCQFRDFISLEDMEQAVLHLVDISLAGNNIINLSSGESITVRQMADLIAVTFEELTGESISIHLPENAAPTEEQPLTISCERLMKSGFQPGNNFKREIEHLLIFCQNHFA